MRGKTQDEVSKAASGIKRPSGIVPPFAPTKDNKTFWPNEEVNSRAKQGLFAKVVSPSSIFPMHMVGSMVSTYIILTIILQPHVFGVNANDAITQSATSSIFDCPSSM
jgi:hypothetical protein